MHIKTLIYRYLLESERRSNNWKFPVFIPKYQLIDPETQQTPSRLNPKKSHKLLKIKDKEKNLEHI